MICHQTCSASSSQHTGYHSWLTVPQQQGVFWNEKVELQSMWIWIHNGRCWWSAKGTLTWLLWNFLTAKYFLTYFFWEASSHRSQQLLGLSSTGEREGRKRAVFEGATLVGILNQKTKTEHRIPHPACSWPLCFVSVDHSPSVKQTAHHTFMTHREQRNGAETVMLPGS